MNEHNEKLREIIVSKSSIIKFVRFYVPLFENASVDNAILITSKQSTKRNIFDIIDVKDSYKELENIDSYRTEQNLISSPAYLFDFGSDINDKGLLARIEKQPLLNVLHLHILEYKLLIEVFMLVLKKKTIVLDQ